MSPGFFNKIPLEYSIPCIQILKNKAYVTPDATILSVKPSLLWARAKIDEDVWCAAVNRVQVNVNKFEEIFSYTRNINQIAKKKYNTTF
jgi:hypothetical protein